jgi:hypothetical protein
MRQPFGSTDFFALEAGDCLDRLERLLARPEGIPGDEFVRQVRLLRGAALMAHMLPIAQAGAAFEGVARAVRDGVRPWDTTIREISLGAVDDFRGLVRRATHWDADAETHARRLAAQLAELAGSVPDAPVAGAGPEASAGIRAFVERQGARLAAALADAARSIEAAPSQRDVLEAVLTQLQPLRGLAGLSELGSVPDVLDGIELAVTGLRQAQTPPAQAAALLDAASHALAAAAHGEAEAPSVPAFAAVLLAHLGEGADIVPIESLFVDGDPAPYVTVGGAPQPLPRTLGAVELVSQGEHFTQVADRLAEARGPAERDLRLAGLLGTLHALQSSGAAMPGVAAFARDALRRIADGDVAREPETFVALLRRAADLLRRAGESPETFAPNAWDALLRKPRAELPVAAAMEPDVVPIETLLADESDEDIVPIESLLLEDEVVPIERLAPDAPTAAGRAPWTAFEASVDAYMTRVRTGAAAPRVVPSDASPVVAITDLVFRGMAARTRAVELHAEVGKRLRDGHDWTSLRPLIEEILDLVPLSLDDD